MIRVREVIVVEGKYDKIRLSSVVDALILETRGFAIFKDREQMELLRMLARERGLLVLTDSDSAGFVIRDYLSGVIPPDQIRHAYIPPWTGRERRKTAPSKEGLLGVEGIDNAVIEAVIRRSGATIENERNGPPEHERPITKMDLYTAGLTGGENSTERRQQLLALLGLPKLLSTNRLVGVLNATMKRERLEQILRDFGWIQRL